MSDPAIMISNLNFQIRGQSLLDNINACMGRGETWSIIGANGAGKSTLLKCLMRIHSSWKGQITLHGRAIETYSQRELARRMAYVPQPGGNQQFPFTVEEFVGMGRYAHSGAFGTSSSSDQDAISTAMQRAHVEVFAKRTLDTLSGGERQKVFIAAALAQQGEVLLLDEPTAFLDYRHQFEVAEILHEINRETKSTIISVTHDVNAAMLNGGHALALRNGRVAWSGPVAELACEKTLGLIFEASFRFLDDPVSGLRLVAPQGASK